MPSYASSWPLEIGTVIRSYVEDTNPPKVKYWIVVGETADSVGLATVYINTMPTPFIQRNAVLANAQYRLDPDSRQLVQHICYADCSQIIPKSVIAIRELLSRKPQSIQGELYPEEIDEVLRLIRECTNISTRIKKQYGIL